MKETIGALSRTFPELELQAKGTTEEAFRHVTDLVNNLQVKVVELEAKMIPCTS